MIKRLIDYPEEYAVAPEDVFERIREIDPNAEIIGMSDGVWWLGVVKPLAARVEAGRRALKTYEKLGFEKSDPVRWPVIRNALLMVQGFGLIGKYRFSMGADFGAMIEEFRYADYMDRKYENGTPEVRAELEGIAEQEQKMRSAAKIVDRIKGDRRYMWKKLFRGAKSIPVGAQLHG